MSKERHEDKGETKNLSKVFLTSSFYNYGPLLSLLVDMLLLERPLMVRQDDLSPGAVTAPADFFIAGSPSLYKGGREVLAKRTGGWSDRRTLSRTLSTGWGDAEPFHLQLCGANAWGNIVRTNERERQRER